jgi:hypothetical protein
VRPRSDLVLGLLAKNGFDINSRIEVDERMDKCILLHWACVGFPGSSRDSYKYIGRLLAVGAMTQSFPRTLPPALETTPMQLDARHEGPPRYGIIQLLLSRRATLEVPSSTRLVTTPFMEFVANPSLLSLRTLRKALPEDVGQWPTRERASPLWRRVPTFANSSNSSRHTS